MMFSYDTDLYRHTKWGYATAIQLKCPLIMFTLGPPKLFLFTAEPRGLKPSTSDCSEYVHIFMQLCCIYLCKLCWHCTLVLPRPPSDQLFFKMAAHKPIIITNHRLIIASDDRLWKSPNSQKYPEVKTYVTDVIQTFHSWCLP